jgi:hypothetical protein
MYIFLCKEVFDAIISVIITHTNIPLPKLAVLAGKLWLTGEWATPGNES